MGGLNDAGLLQSTIGAILLNGAQGASGDVDDDRLLEFRYVDALSLEIGVATNRSGRIELCGASPVGIATADDRASLCDLADISHKSS